MYPHEGRTRAYATYRCVPDHHPSAPSTYLYAPIGSNHRLPRHSSRMEPRVSRGRRPFTRPGLVAGPAVRRSHLARQRFGSAPVGRHSSAHGCGAATGIGRGPRFLPRIPRTRIRGILRYRIVRASAPNLRRYIGQLDKHPGTKNLVGQTHNACQRTLVPPSAFQPLCYPLNSSASSRFRP